MPEITFSSSRFFFVLLALLATSGCGGFVGDDPMDRFLTAEIELDQLLDHPTAVGVLALVNDPAVADVAFLDHGLALDSRAAARIVAHRQGPDGLDGTYDDDTFGSIIELDTIPYVSDAALLALGDAAWELDYVPAFVIEGVAFSAGDAEAVLLLANEGSMDALDDDAALDVRAAESIIAGRPYHHVTELAAQPHVGPSALRAMLAFSESWLQ